MSGRNLGSSGPEGWLTTQQLLKSRVYTRPPIVIARLCPQLSRRTPSFRQQERARARVCLSGCPAVGAVMDVRLMLPAHHVDQFVERAASRCRRILGR